MNSTFNFFFSLSSVRTPVGNEYVPVITSLTLGEERSLTSLVLGNLVGGVLLAGLALAIGVAGLGNVDLKW